MGFYPNSEREVQNLINFTLKNKPLLTISYHTKGNIIYYGFDNQTEENKNRDRIIGERLSEITGYPLIYTENSTGGYKDWCIEKLTIPSYTIEVGDNNLNHPIEIENLPEIYARNKDIPLVALNLANEFAKSIDFISPMMQNITEENKHEQHLKREFKLYGKSYLNRLQSFAQKRNSNWRNSCKR